MPSGTGHHQTPIVRTEVLTTAVAASRDWVAPSGTFPEGHSVPTLARRAALRGLVLWGEMAASAGFSPLPW